MAAQQARAVPLLMLRALAVPALCASVLACSPRPAPEAPPPGAEAVEVEAPREAPQPRPVEDAAAAARQPTDSRPGIAVLPFAAGISLGTERENLDALSIGLQQILITELAQNPALRVVERGVIRDLLQEQELGASQRVDPATAARLGRIVGAKYVLTGGFNDVDQDFRLDGRIVDVETSEILRAVEVTDRRDRLYRVVVEMARRVTNGVNLPPLQAELRRERETRGATLPRDAVILYSQAQFFQDRGQLDRARELYRRVTTEFPALTEAREALQRMGSPEG